MLLNSCLISLEEGERMENFNEEDFDKKQEASIKAWESGYKLGIKGSTSKVIIGSTPFDKGFLAGQESFTKKKK